LNIREKARKQVAKNKTEELAIGDLVRIKMSSLFSSVRRMIKQGEKKYVVVKYTPEVYRVKQIIRPDHEHLEKNRYTVESLNGRLLKSNNGGIKRFFATDFIRADDAANEQEGHFNIRDALNLNKVVELEGDIATPADMQPNRNLATAPRTPVRPANERYNIIPTAPIGSRTRNRVHNSKTVTTPPTKVVATPPTKVVATPPTKVVTTPTKVVATPTKVVATPTKVVTTPTKVVATPPTKVVATPPTKVVATPTKVVATPPPIERIKVGNYLVDKTPSVRTTRNKTNNSTTIGGKIIVF